MQRRIFPTSYLQKYDRTALEVGAYSSQSLSSWWCGHGPQKRFSNGVKLIKFSQWTRFSLVITKWHLNRICVSKFWLNVCKLWCVIVYPPVFRWCIAALLTYLHSVYHSSVEFLTVSQVLVSWTALNSVLGVFISDTSDVYRRLHDNPSLCL